MDTSRSKFQNLFLVRLHRKDVEITALKRKIRDMDRRIKRQHDKIEKYRLKG